MSFNAYGECFYAECQYAECPISLFIVMLNVIKLSVVILSVVVPLGALVFHHLLMPVVVILQDCQHLCLLHVGTLSF